MLNSLFVVRLVKFQNIHILWSYVWVSFYLCSNSKNINSKDKENRKYSLKKGNLGNSKIWNLTPKPRGQFISKNIILVPPFQRWVLNSSIYPNRTLPDLVSFQILQNICRILPISSNYKSKANIISKAKENLSNVDLNSVYMLA